MKLIGYHGTNRKIEMFSMDHLGTVNGQSRFPGIYFSPNYDMALEYANYAVSKLGGKPIVYLAECELEKPLDARKNKRIFNSLSDILEFTKKYFPNWFGPDGNIRSYKLDYIRGKLETYNGNYNLIQYAAEENGLSLLEVCLDLGFDSLYDTSEFCITSPNQILQYCEVDHELTSEEFEEMKLITEQEIERVGQGYSIAYEAKSNDYVRASRKGKPYKTMPGNRFMRRLKIHMNGGNNVWFDLDMNRLFKKGSFSLNIPVIGETDQYTCSISFDNWLDKLKEDIGKTGFTQMTVKRSLTEMLRFSDLKVRCSCPDFKYRHAYWLTVHQEIEGDQENRPSDITNPKDDLGKVCKHLIFLINNKIYNDKESRIIYNYLVNLKRTQRFLFDRMVASKLGLETEAEEKKRLEAEQKAAMMPQEDEEPETFETTQQEEDQPIQQDRPPVDNTDEGESTKGEEEEEDE